ncbi:hypothetical protein G9444_2501 [Rhodococcus erythropolis]|uniref:Uncharacterized protein n=1 Tax=Rhodococcus erythropolis TaxID=1833 RepID=A0A6G9CRS0_RHOER|nr:hypothetical protein [Rhodococcus erythropolis]QIP39745.1 hypothetical protein G9444_2501 [Rhodococcus erythropolis]
MEGVPEAEADRLVPDGEDIIRETFEKFGAAIGVQMQVPAAMIANLGAVLQAQIDLLAELQSTGRLVPTGGMALTAEEWADVQTVSNCAIQYGNIASREAAYRLAVRFPETEPAEEAPNLAAVAQEPRRFDPADECQNDNHDPGCVCGAQHWMTTPAPAEPAEEETKAEGRDPDELAKRMALIWEGGWDEFDEKERDYLRCAAEIARAYYASSPVVPAPTETGPQTLEGPWDRIEDVPKTVGRLTDRDGDIWEWDGDNWVTPETAILPTTYINRKYAPFVAAAEG